MYLKQRNLEGIKISAFHSHLFLKINSNLLVVKCQNYMDNSYLCPELLFKFLFVDQKVDQFIYSSESSKWFN